MDDRTSAAVTATSPLRTESRPAAFACVVCACGRAVHCRNLRPDPPRRPFGLVICGDCGLVQQHPRYTPAHIARLYSADYYVFDESDSHRWARAVQQHVVHLLPLEPADGRRLLDVGCALGHFAALAARRGWSVVGVDISADAARRAAEQFGIETRAGELSELAAAAAGAGGLGSFDCIFLGDVIEHVLEPVAFMTQVRGLLRPGGCVCIDTPNFAGRWRRWGGRRWLGFNPFHINLFDAGSLTRLLERCGFRDVRTGSYTHFRYESFASRPEAQAWMRWLPKSLAWRFNRRLDAAAGASHWSALRNAPPASLVAADAALRAARPAADWYDHTQQDGDNLTAAGRIA